MMIPAGEKIHPGDQTRFLTKYSYKQGNRKEVLCAAIQGASERGGLPQLRQIGGGQGEEGPERDAASPTRHRPSGYHHTRRHFPLRSGFCPARLFRGAAVGVLVGGARRCVLSLLGPPPPALPRGFVGCVPVSWALVGLVGGSRRPRCGRGAPSPQVRTS